MSGTTRGDRGYSFIGSRPGSAGGGSRPPTRGSEGAYGDVDSEPSDTDGNPRGAKVLTKKYRKDLADDRPSSAEGPTAETSKLKGKPVTKTKDFDQEAYRAAFQPMIDRLTEQYPQGLVFSESDVESRQLKAAFDESNARTERPTTGIEGPVTVNSEGTAPTIPAANMLPAKGDTSKRSGSSDKSKDRSVGKPKPFGDPDLSTSGSEKGNSGSQAAKEAAKHGSGKSGPGGTGATAGEKTGRKSW